MEAGGQVDADAARQQNELKLKMLLQQLLSPGALGRLNNIRMSNPELFQQLAQFIISLFQQGRVQGKVSEEQLKALAARLLQERKQTKITFMRK